MQATGHRDVDAGLHPSPGRAVTIRMSGWLSGGASVAVVGFARATTYIVVNLAAQRLTLLCGDAPLLEFGVSTASNGSGERLGSGCTPRGWHVIRARIGAGCPAGTVFVGRRPTGERFSAQLAALHPARDWILTRILWLGGLEPGRNRYGVVDTLRRYIYIHGAPETVPMGRPRSHGCIRMPNDALIELFARVAVGTRVLIEE